ncbi:NACHT and WD repeat domain-containing protein [Nocardia sp. CA-107356]|uniref:NACHT and WD repeat domain-containing protein n=1 Tax=Nocardia sp. CA-107356 TaxID=3239972 RepID=UPI003D908AFB
MIEACQSARFVSRLQNALNDRSYPGCYLLISPTIDEGAVTLGRWQAMLHNILHKTFATEDVLLDRFAKALSSRDVTVKQSGPIADDIVALVRRIRLPANISVDAREELARAIGSLPLDVQRHFITKAHGGLGSFEHVVLNEQSWYFEGREEATRHVVSWLREHRSGMLVITGPPGSGKSAFLGNLIVHANPALRTALRRAGLLAKSPDTVPDKVFDTCLSLIGAPTIDVIAKLAAAMDIAIPDDVMGRDAADAGRWLALAIRTRGTPLTIVVDALDEAVFPEELANHVLGPLGRLPKVRLLVGTRQSTQDQIDSPTTDTNLLRALGASERNLVSIRSDHQAVRRFVAHRLRNRVRMDVDRFADAVAQRNTHFLIAQLAVHEVLSDPHWHSDNTWDDLLARNHRGIFSLAVDRLSRKHPSYPGLLISLAFSAGHGLPIHDGLWRNVAQAVAVVDNSHAIDDHDIERFIDDAAPYVIVDNEHQQTVYRLAHRTFAEYFVQGYHTEHRHFFATEISESAITAALITAAGEAAADGSADLPVSINPYIRHYLSTHAANAGAQGWQLLNNEKLLALLDPEQVGADAERAAFGRVVLPPLVDGIANAREWLRRTDRQYYGFASRIAAARTTGFHTKTAPVDPHAIVDMCWATVQRRMSFRTLTGHTDSVVTFAVVPASDGGVWLASASRDGTIRLWNPTTGQPLGVLSGHNGAVTALAVAGDGILASVGEDHRLLIWDLRSKQPLATLTDHVDGVALAAIPMADKRFLLACSSGAAIQVWDLVTSRLMGVLVAHTGGVTALAFLIDPDHGSLLISAGADSMIRVWNAIDGREITSVPSPAGPVTQLAALQYDRKILLAAVADGRVTLMNLTGTGPWRPTQSHGNPITSMAVMSLGKWGALVAGAGRGTISLWDVSSVLFDELSPGIREGFSLGSEWGWKRSATEPISTLSGQITDTSEATALATIPLPDHGALLASAHYATIRLWNPTAGLWNSAVEQASSGIRLTEHRGAVTALAAVSTPSRKTTMLASSCHDRPVALHLADSGEPLGFLGTFINRTNTVTALVTIRGADGNAMLATASDDGGICLWNCVPGQGPGITLPSHGSLVTALAAVTTTDGTTLLASAGRDGVICLWDPAAGQRPPIATISDHGPAITALVSVPGASRTTLLASADVDGNVRIFDPSNPSGKELLGTFSGGTAAVRALTVISGTGGPLLASASQDGRVNIFDPMSPAAAQPIAVMHGHKGAVTALTAWLPALFVSGGRDSTIRLWTPTETAPLHTIPVDAPINTMVALPGEQLAVGLDDGLLVLRIDTTAIWKAER